MLSHLALKNFVLIDALSLDFSDGLAVITGETGAGKSILLDSLGLVTGGRSDIGLIGQNGERAEVSATFELSENHPALLWLQEQELEDGTNLVMRRTIGSDGRTKAFINGSSVPVGSLTQAGDALVEIQGQFDQLAILNPRNHIAVLDEAANLLPQSTKVRLAHAERQAASKALNSEQVRLDTLREEEDYLRHSLSELEQAGLVKGEAEELSQRHQALRELSDAAEALAGLKTILMNDKGANAQLAKATKTASRLPGQLAAELESMINSLDQAWNAAESASSDLTAKLYELEDAEKDLEETSERLFHLKDLARKHSCSPDELPDKEAKLRQTLQDIDQGHEQLKQLSKALEEKTALYVNAAQKLSDSRHKHGTKLGKAINDELPNLKLPDAKVAFAIETEANPEGGALGFDSVRLMVKTNASTPEGPLNKVASGGELSRILLALKLALTPEDGHPPLMIFDEADAGVGGATAAALGMRLRALGKSTQVLAVTHSPQMAAAGNVHLKVSKSTKDKVTGSRIDRLNLEERTQEIGRMIAGSEIGTEALDAAKKLLNEFA